MRVLGDVLKVDRMISGMAVSWDSAARRDGLGARSSMVQIGVIETACSIAARVSSADPGSAELKSDPLAAQKAIICFAVIDLPPPAGPWIYKVDRGEATGSKTGTIGRNADSNTMPATPR